MDTLMIWLNGKKTYLTALAFLVCGILADQGVTIPEYVWAALGALGLGFLRVGVAKSAPAETNNMVKPAKGSKIAPFLALGLGLSLVLTAGGCVGTQPMSNSQQYGIASASVRAVVDSLKVAGDNHLISDEDIIAIDPIIRQAFDSLRSMRTAILEQDTIKCQWYLLQAQQIVAKLGMMESQAKEMKNVDYRSSSLDGDYRRNERGDGLDPSPGRSQRRYARILARRARRSGCVELAKRTGLGGDGGGSESEACWRTPCPVPLLSLIPEVEYD